MVSEAAFFVLRTLFQVPARAGRGCNVSTQQGSQESLVGNIVAAPRDPVMVQIPQLDLSSTSSGQAAQSRGIPGLGDAQFGWESGEYGKNTWRSLSGRLPPTATDLVITCRFFQLTGVRTLMCVYGYASHVCVCVRVPVCVCVLPRACALHRGPLHQRPEGRECTRVHTRVCVHKHVLNKRCACTWARVPCI